MRSYRILIIGPGRVGAHILDLLVRIPGNHAFFVGGRDLASVRQRANLSLFAAMQLGYTPNVTCISLDISNIDQTAETIAHLHPDIIICAATLQTSDTHRLPDTLATQLASAPAGPRLPLHLALIYLLMRAIRLTGQAIILLNLAYPDVVSPVLHKVGLAPTTGVGDLANNIPALRTSIASTLLIPVEQVDVRLITARYTNYWMSRTIIRNRPFHLTVLVNGEDVTQILDLETVFDSLSTRFKRQGGSTGSLMTATSAIVVCEGMMRDTGVITHAPGPNGFPGGYPVRVTARGVEIMLPDSLTMEDAVRINEANLQLDGIEKIESDGTVLFTETSTSKYKEILGYDCRRMPLSEVEEQAKELQARYVALARKYQ